MFPPAVQELLSYSKVESKNVFKAGPVDPPKVNPAVTIPVPDVFHLTLGSDVPLDHAPAVITFVDDVNSSVKADAGGPPPNATAAELLAPVPAILFLAVAQSGPSVPDVPFHDSALAVAGGVVPPYAKADV